MKKIYSFIFFLWFFVSNSFSFEEPSEFLYDYYLNMGDHFYQRHDFHNNLSLTFHYYQQAFLTAKNKPEIYWKLARTLWVEQEKVADEEQKIESLEKANWYLEQGAKRFPNNVDIVLWGAIVNGSYLLHSNLLQSLLILREKVKQDLEIVLEARPESLRALSALGYYYLKVPQALGGDDQQAIFLFQKVLDINKDFHRASLYLAEVYIDRQEWQLARGSLNRVLRATTSEELGFFSDFQKQAKELLETIPQNNL